MNNTLTLGTCKRLVEHLKDTEIKNYYEWGYLQSDNAFQPITDFKAPNLEEALELIVNKWNKIGIMCYEYPKLRIQNKDIVTPYDTLKFISSIENVEKMINYLLDNHLLKND